MEKSSSEDLNEVYNRYLEMNKTDKNIFISMWILMGFLVLLSIYIFYYVLSDDDTIVVNEDEVELSLTDSAVYNTNNYNNYFVTSLKNYELN